MRLVIALPNRIHTDAEASRVRAEGLHGSFTMLPRHLDQVVLLAPGILSFVSDHAEHYVAVDGGVLTKVGGEVRVSTVAAVAGDRLEDLEPSVIETFRRLDERDRSTRIALARIESHVMHELFEFEERS